ncbi:MAG: bifunctional homocysteine S-methyltransferase/methylenetetrahydrofolate reductase [Gemmatimonadota bacterium]|nr:bifunctional homocysteine S-methyltransferase/methylenetetrahydrofolate reductase [Gemmatimonadota bacterium]
MKHLIEDGRVHVFDGAMGTLLYSRGVFVNVCYDELNLDHPDTVRRIHAEYVAAGAEILETNTFGANPVKLSAYGLADRTEELNRAAAGIALEAAGNEVSVAGAVGPLGIRVEPFGPTSRDEARAYFGRQVDGLLEGGVHGLVLETFSDLTEIECALGAVRERTDLPVVAQMTVGQDGRTSYGADSGQIARALTDLGVDVVGLNCSVGPAVMLDAIEAMAHATSLPLVAQPNAGLPRTVGDRTMYLASPEYMAQYALRMIDVGVRFVGGCCGTTPDHIREIRAGVASTQPRHASIRVPAEPPEAEPAEAAKVPLEHRSAWGRKLARGEPVVSVELLPPDGWATDELVERARELKVAGVDAVEVLESPVVRSHMSALSACTVIEREVGIETLLHYTCRDKNMLGMISDLLGAAASGLHNLIVVTGDLPAMGPYPDATAVFDIDAIGLTNVIQGLNRGVDPGGNSIGKPTEFVQGIAINQGAVDQERELRRFSYKVEAGADFAITQPIFDPTALERFLEAAPHPIPVIAGIWPLVDLRNAEFLANEMPGVKVPERVVERMREAEESGGKDGALEEGVRIALETIEAVRPLVQGFHVNAPARRTDVALRVVQEGELRATG